MRISIPEVIDRLYAVTALATLSPAARIALLQPDHADALAMVVRDNIALLLSSLPKGIVERVELKDDAVEIAFAHESDDNESSSAAIISIATTLVLAQLKISASDSPEMILGIASLLPSLADRLAQAFSSPAAPSRITPS